MTQRIVLFASGSGSNAARIADYFETVEGVEIAALFSNRKKAAVLERPQFKEVPTVIFNKVYFNSSAFVNALEAFQPDLIVLAGFLWKVPPLLVSKFPQKIINIHPSLLPKYGGKGMYGMHVHQAVYEQKETETGISIHYVNEHYDEGQLIFQAQTTLTPEDTPEIIAQKIHALEYEHFPKVLAQLLR